MSYFFRIQSVPTSQRNSARLHAWGMFLCFLLTSFSGVAGEWKTGEGFRSQDLSLPPNGRTFLQRLSPTNTGITFTNFLSEEKGQENSLLTLGAGVAAGDVDGDGLCDLYFIGTQKPNALYRNLGNWKFEDITATAGVACAGQFSSGAVFADVDGDGDLDLLVTSIGNGTRLFLNDGKGHFSEPADSGLIKKFGATSMALADVDGNGTLDLYVANYATTKLEDRPNSRFESKMVNGKVVLTAINGVPMTSPELTNRYIVDSDRVVRELGEPDILYLNDGHGKFKPVSWTDGTFLDEQGKPLTQPLYDFGLSVMFRDFNGDGAPDIYICNDLFPPDRIWINDGKGRFRAMSNLAVRNTCRFAMGVDFADINRDGYDDFFVVDMLSRDHVNRKTQVVGVPSIINPVGKFDTRLQYKKNTLFLNRGDGTFAEIAQFAGLEATEWSWMPVFLDVDLDGYEDVLVTTGHYRDSLNADAVEQILQARKRGRLTDAEHRELKKKLYPVLKHSNLAFRNKGDLTFEPKEKEWGFDYTGISQGMCLADLDNDGDLDVIVNHQNDQIGIYRNESSAPRVAVRLKGKAPNTRGIGARIKFTGGPVPQSQEMISGGRYLSCDDNMRMFAVGSSTSGMSIEVNWRSGTTSVVKDVQPNRLYEVEEAGAAKTSGSKSEPALAKPIFSDVSSLLGHTHVDEGFNDFERQPLLGKRLSQLGPGVSWYDVDGDGLEDLIIGGGVGGRLAVYRNDGKGGFKSMEKPGVGAANLRDQTTILGWTKKNGQRVLLAGSSNYEDGEALGACVREFDFSKDTVKENLPPWECSTGPLAMGDWDGDGNLDLFVGGRAMPGKYPDEPFSLLFQGNGEQLTLDKDAVKQLFQAGMVSGAIVTDLDGDGFGDLVLACEWGPVRVFRWEVGKWRERTAELGLDQYRGWWNGVAVGDFDGDGRMDIVASNWGRNTKYQRYRERPLRIYFGDWKGNGMFDSMEAYADPGLKKIVPWCNFGVAKSLPWVAEQFPTFTAFGHAGVEEILGARTNTTRMFAANWLETTIFLNRGNHFEARALPAEAQLSPAFGISVADVDGDGKEDIFLSQNFFAVDGDTPRYDAGRGLWLLGDGEGGFKALSGQESGVKVYGEQRGCAVSDYDGDGRVDLVVTQNGAETKLFHNETAKPGLRVRLIGPPGNPNGVGGIIRLMSDQKTGPAREVHSGSGYWSQDSFVQVMATLEGAKEIVVHWPGGKATQTKLPPSAREVSVDTKGTLKVLK
ncbi:MAG: ASPIC/UnbV domain protein [Verrucomicrobiales bacterium]|nr:ASPIC/UnbV domain protein [Verrucomicrobiales bacterium]